MWDSVSGLGASFLSVMTETINHKGHKVSQRFTKENKNEGLYLLTKIGFSANASFAFVVNGFEPSSTPSRTSLLRTTQRAQQSTGRERSGWKLRGRFDTWHIRERTRRPRSL